MTTFDPGISSQEDADTLAELGYTQELHRGIGGYAAFASGFSFVSILTTVFAFFPLGFALGGPAFFWTWPIVFVCQFCVCLVFAELSGKFPVAGAIYQWSRRLAGNAVGWFAGWFMLIGYIVSIAALAISMPTVLPPMVPPPAQVEAERRRFEIDNMVASNPEKAADYLRGLMDDRQPV